MHDQGKKHNEVVVKDIMTPKSKLSCVDLHAIEKSSIGNLLPTIRNLAFQHLLVADFNTNGTNIDRIIGIISTSQIARALGQSLDTLKLPSSLYDIQKALS